MLEVHRFSPYHASTAQFPLKVTGPKAFYRHVYPLDDAALSDIAYAFAYEYTTPQDPYAYSRPLAEALEAAPIAIEFVAAAATDAAATIAEKGIQQFALQTARTAWASQKFRKLIAFKIVKDGLKAWLLFSDRGKLLTAPVRRQVSQVIHAKCTSTAPTDEAVTFGGP